MATRNLPTWRLKIRKDGEELYCTMCAGGSWKPGAYKNPVTLGFSRKDDIQSVYGGIPFKSRSQALWYWFEFCKTQPEATKGWYAVAFEFEV